MFLVFPELFVEKESYRLPFSLHRYHVYVIHSNTSQPLLVLAQYLCVKTSQDESTKEIIQKITYAALQTGSPVRRAGLL